MKLVFTIAEVAEVLQLTVEEFLERQPVLERNGFPKPLPGLESRWSIIDVVNWVNSSVRTPVDRMTGYWPALSPHLS